MTAGRQLSSNLADTADRGLSRQSAARGQADSSEALVAMVATLEGWQAERDAPLRQDSRTTWDDRALDGVDLSAFKKIVCLRGVCLGVPGVARMPVPASQTDLRYRQPPTRPR